MSVRDAVLAETMEKLMVMHDAGGHPTELVGIDECGDYLIAKQPLASPFSDLHQGNVMREPSEAACIIDALLAPLAPQSIQGNRMLAESVEDARLFRSTGLMSARKAFDDVRDNEL